MYHRSGIHALVDGQFGSTGKGLLAKWIAGNSGPKPFDIVVSNAGPNSGHTSFVGDRRIVLKQLPTLAVVQKLAGADPLVYLSAGAVIDPDILLRECHEYGVRVWVSPQATVITDEDREAETKGSVAAVAGTRQGVGAALARKVLRDRSAVLRHSEAALRLAAEGVRLHEPPDWAGKRVFVEISQGFSLGINSEFYPKVTSRECTVMQGLADARIHPSFLASTSMVVRTFPIRVGNVDGHSSGDWYADQRELEWRELNVEPETTTVTGRVRRVATFSKQQYQDALRANRPQLILVNFMNYLTSEDRRVRFAEQMAKIARDSLGYKPRFVYGFGPDEITAEPSGRGTNAELARRDDAVHAGHSAVPGRDGAQAGEERG